MNAVDLTDQSRWQLGWFIYTAMRCVVAVTGRPIGEMGITPEPEGLDVGTISAPVVFLRIVGHPGYNPVTVFGRWQAFGAWLQQQEDATVITATDKFEAAARAMTLMLGTARHHGADGGIVRWSDVLPLLPQ